MEIFINNKPAHLTEPLTIQQLLDREMPGKQKGTAVAINNTVIPKTDWDQKYLADHDQVLIIRATQGG